jgi:hypothetical protein
MFLGGWMDGWMDGWMEVKAVLKSAYSNQKFQLIYFENLVGVNKLFKIY